MDRIVASRLAIAGIALASLMATACTASVTPEPANDASSPATDASNPATDASFADDAADADLSCRPDDRCCFAMNAPGQGRECSPTNACDPSLDCIYAAGCTDPKGKCQPWGRCPDSAILETVCQCDGGTGYSREVPISAFGDACAP